jgi:hypothetical protein
VATKPFLLFWHEVNPYSGVQNPVFHPLVERKIKEEGFRGYKAQNVPNSLRIPFLRMRILLL